MSVACPRCHLLLSAYCRGGPNMCALLSQTVQIRDEHSTFACSRFGFAKIHARPLDWSDLTFNSHALVNRHGALTLNGCQGAPCYEEGAS